MTHKYNIAYIPYIASYKCNILQLQLVSVTSLFCRLCGSYCR